MSEEDGPQKINGAQPKPEDPTYNVALAEMFERVLGEVKAGRWYSGAVILAAPPYQVMYQYCSPKELEILLGSGANGLNKKLADEVFPNKPAPSSLVRAHGIPRRPLIG